MCKGLQSPESLGDGSRREQLLFQHRNYTH
jgi:hypothetical protein